jgi:hypothetical protein
MSACLETLLADTPERKAQADAADRAVKATTRAIRSQRFETIRAMCTDNATVSGYTSQPALAANYEGAIRALCGELDALAGRNATPQSGCFHVPCFLDDAEVLVEFEYQPEEGDGWNEPHYDESVTVLCALVNGVWVDADQFADAVHEAWIQRGADWLDEQRQESEDMKAEARAEARFA